MKVGTQTPYIGVKLVYLVSNFYFEVGIASLVPIKIDCFNVCFDWLGG